MISLASISKTQTIKAPRMVVLGVEKIGKTTFSCGSRFKDGRLEEIGLNSPIIIPIKGEEGSDALDVSAFPPCTTIDGVLECIGSLYSEDHEFKTVVIDSASALAPIIQDDVCAEFSVSNVRKVPGFRTGECAVMQRWRTILAGLDALRESKNMASIIIGHVKIKKYKNPEGDDWDWYDFDMDMGEQDDIKRWADVILFCNTRVTVKKEGEDSRFSKAKKTGLDLTGGQRFFYTHKNPAHPGGGRGIYGHLPEEVELDWASFQDAIAAASAAMK